jgi:hypothetical protein
VVNQLKVKLCRRIRLPSTKSTNRKSRQATEKHAGIE